jgi:Protein of unknown function (DUF1264)
MTFSNEKRTINTTTFALLVAGISGMIFSGSNIAFGLNQTVNQTQMEQEENKEPLYNKDLNPRQKEYDAILGFNDLHIEAINHINPNMTSDHNPDVLKRIVHHHCKVYDDMSAVCLLFPTGMGDQDKPYGIEYIITTKQYGDLPKEEQKYWTYLKTILPKVNATLPDLTSEEAAKLIPVLSEMYGKLVYFWQYGDKYPIGQPQVLILRDITG